MAGTKRTFLFSNSTTKLWAFCKRAFFNGALREGMGLESKFVDEDLLFGTIIHEVLPVAWAFPEKLREAILAAAEKLEKALLEDKVWFAEALPEFRVSKAAEWRRLLEGQLWGISRVVLPRLRGMYDLVVAEGDAVRWLPEWDSAGYRVGLSAKPDTLLIPTQSLIESALEDELKGQPGIGYLEWKTVAVPSDGWHKGWLRNPQAWTGAICTKAALEQEIEWFGVCGLVKGVERDGKRYSPFCYIYALAPGLPTKVDGADYWTTEDGWRWRCDHTAAKGWIKVSTSEYPGGLEALVAAMPETVLSEQFVLTVPDDIDWELAEEWLGNQKVMVDAALEFKRDALIATTDPRVSDPQVTLQSIVGHLFPRSLEKCEAGGFGQKQCGWKRLCHDPEVAAEPLTFYRKRVPHHQLEAELAEVE